MNRETFDAFNPLHYRNLTRTSKVYTRHIVQADDCMSIFGKCCFPLVAVWFVNTNKFATNK